MASRTLIAGVVAVVAMSASSTFAPLAAGPVAAAGGSIIDDPACMDNVLPANDDGSTAAIDLGFTARFGAGAYSTVYINNNGNVTFSAPLRAYTPEALARLEFPIIAPFWADVDTRSSGSDPVRYGWGETTFDGRPALCINWIDVGYFSQGSDKLNSFQLLLVDREHGDFDAVFNYGQVQWEAGSASGGVGGLGGQSARAGFSSGEQWFEVAGSAVPGSLIDSGTAPLIGRSLGVEDSPFGPEVTGRFVFRFEDGTFAPDASPEGGVDVGKRVYDQNVGARVEIDVALDLDPFTSSGPIVAEIVSGPHVGTEVVCIFFCDGTFALLRPSVGYRGQRVGDDLVRIYFDTNGSGERDPGEPRTFVTVRWRDPLHRAALGDSYSAGEGLEGSGDGGYLAGVDGFKQCHRSADAWPSILEVHDRAATGTEVFSFVACTSARTFNVIRDPLVFADLSTAERDDSEGPHPDTTGRRQGEVLEDVGDVPVDLVTITIGGNDADWTTVITECIMKGSDNCFDDEVYPGTDMTLREWADYRMTVIPDRIAATMRDITAIAPDATVVLAGYPVFAPPASVNCYEGPVDTTGTLVGGLIGGVTGGLGAFWASREWTLGPEEFGVFRELQLAFEPEMARAAAEARVHYVSVADAFAGHEICGDEGSWVNGLDLNFKLGKPEPETRSFHPKPEGHEAYARAVTDYLDDLVERGWPLNPSGLPTNPHPPLVIPSLQAAVAAAPSLRAATASVDVTGYQDPCGATTIRPGEPIDIGVDDLPAGIDIQVRIASLGGTTVYTAAATADAAGRAAISFDVPVDAPAGQLWWVSATAANDDVLVIGNTGPFASMIEDPPCLTDVSVSTALHEPVSIDLTSAVSGPGDDMGSWFAPGSLHGTTSVDGGILTYSPAFGFVGVDTVDTVRCLPSGWCGVASISITVEPACTIVGTDEDDDLVGTDGPDVICGLSGDDVIRGMGGDDILVGGPGDDYLTGGPGADDVIGGNGRDHYSLTAGDRSDADDDEIVVGGDNEPPTVTFTPTPVGDEFVLGSGVTIEYTCDDPAGVEICEGDVATGGALDTSTPGRRTFDVVAADALGNTAVSTFTYRVVYTFEGFVEPVGGRRIVANAGRTIPLKWLLAGAVGPVNDPASVASLSSQELSCDGAEFGEVIPADSSGGGLIHLGDGHWRYNWVTERAWAGTCRQFVLELSDGRFELVTAELR